MTKVLIQFLSVACVITLILTVEIASNKYIKTELIQFSESILAPALGFTKKDMTPSLEFIQPEIKTAFQNPFKDIFRIAHSAVNKSFQQDIAKKKTSDHIPEKGSSIRVFMDESQTKGGGR